MKIKKKMISLVLLLTISINVLGVFANTVSIDQAWNKLTSSQKSQLEDAGLGFENLNKIDSQLGGLDISVLVSPLLKYENNNFVVSQRNFNKALDLLEIKEGKRFDRDNMTSKFNDAVADINQNSPIDAKEDFAQLLSQYKLAEIGQSAEPGNDLVEGGMPVSQEEVKEKLELKLINLKNTENKTKAQDADFQKALETLSGYMNPLTEITSKDLEKTWQASINWQNENAKETKFGKVNTPVAQLNVKSGQEVVIPEKLWKEDFSSGEIRLNLGSVVICIDKSTYNNGASKITIDTSNKDGYKQSVKISNSAKMNLPAKLTFYIEDEEAEDYAVYRLEEGKEILVGGIYNSAVGAVEALAKSSGTYVLKKAPVQSYKDLDGFDWAKEEINHLGQKGYVAGKSEGTYAPKDDITRAEVAVLISRMLQLPGTNDENKFADLKSDDWYYSDIMATVNAGVFNGKAANSFDPKGNITRQEVAAVMSRLLVQKGYSEPKVDVSKGVWAPGALALLKGQTLTTEIPNFDKGINQNANRAEVAYILYNLLQR